MLIWLDATANRKAHPNENYAREVMELFTLGRGNYTEKDIQEAARAFTGWFVMRDRFQRGPRAARRRRRRPMLGQTGRVRRRRRPGDPPRAAGLRRVPLRASSSATSSARSTRPTPGLIAPLAEAFRESGYDVRVPVGDDPAVEPLPRPEPCAAGGSRARSSSPSGRSGPSRSSSRPSRPTPWPRPARGWARASTPRRASPAGTAAPPGSTRRRCWPAPTSPRRCSPTDDAALGQAAATPRPWPRRTALEARGRGPVLSSICWSRTPSSAKVRRQIRRRGRRRGEDRADAASA